MGSGVLLRIKGSNYVATAAHVVDEHKGPIGLAVVKGNEVFGFVDKPLTVVSVKQEDRTYMHGLDMALLVVTEDYSEFLHSQGMTFFNLDENNPPPITKECFISGFPAKRNYFNRHKGAYAPTCGCYHIQSFMKDPDRVLEISGDPEFHFALEMNKKKDFYMESTGEKIPELFGLHGMSGGGVWHMETEQANDMPKCATALAGILIEDWDTTHDRKGLAKAVKIEGIYNLIKFIDSNPPPIASGD